MHEFSETVEVTGHIIDSLVLPKILDEIMALEGTFEILEVQIGHRKTDTSRARITVGAGSRAGLETILRRLSRMGAMPLVGEDVRLVAARRQGVFPEGFYATTNLPTSVRFRGRWRRVSYLEMDCGIVIDPRTGRARCVPMAHINRGDRVVCGRTGVKVSPLERSGSRQVFSFMGSAVSPERPKARILTELAREMRAVRREGRRILVVAGPAVVHTGGGRYLERLIRRGFVDVLFAGNGLATHDVESVLFGTALGVDLRSGVAAQDGHDHHLRAINAIRSCGGLARAVQKKILAKGIMHACITRKIPYVLAGSVRDDGPLLEVITDVMKAQDAMRRQVRRVGLALMIASTLHAIATGNILPATVKTVCVDINPAAVTKLADRGTFQGVGIVSDAASFLRELCGALKL